MGMAAVHQRIADAGLGERPTAGVAVVGLVGPDRRLVALDKRIGGEAVADIGAGEDGARIRSVPWSTARCAL